MLRLLEEGRGGGGGEGERVGREMVGELGAEEVVERARTTRITARGERTTEKGERDSRGRGEKTTYHHSRTGILETQVLSLSRAALPSLKTA
jgi:hypothetical protein